MEVTNITVHDSPQQEPSPFLVHYRLTYEEIQRKYPQWSPRQIEAEVQRRLGGL